MTNRKIKTSVILKTLTDIQTNYKKNSDEWLVLEKSKELFYNMNKIRNGIARAAKLEEGIIKNTT